MNKFDLSMYLRNVMNEGKIDDIVRYLTDLNNVLKDDKYIDLATFIGQPNKRKGADKIMDDEYQNENWLEINEIGNYDEREQEGEIWSDEEKFDRLVNKIEELEQKFERIHDSLSENASFIELYGQFNTLLEGFKDKGDEITEDDVDEYLEEFNSIDTDIGEFEIMYIIEQNHFEETQENLVSGGNISLSNKTDYGESVNCLGHFLIDGTTKMCRKWYNIKSDIQTLKNMFTKYNLIK